MANKLISTMKMPDGTAYDIDAKYLGGYEAEDYAKVEDLDSKADVYDTSSKLFNIQIGDNLTGQTLKFDTTKSTDYVHPYDDFIITFANGKQIKCSWQPNFSINYGIYDGNPFNTLSPYFAQNGAWQLNEYTLLSGEDWTVTNVTYTNQMGTPTPIENLPCVNATSYGDFVDCESNYKAIQALKEQVNNSGSPYTFLGSYVIEGSANSSDISTNVTISPTQIKGFYIEVAYDQDMGMGLTYLYSGERRIPQVYGNFNYAYQNNIKFILNDEMNGIVTTPTNCYVQISYTNGNTYATVALKNLKPSGSTHKIQVDVYTINKSLT